MVSRRNYNLNANEGFVMVLTSKLITWFIDVFTSKRKSQSIAYLHNENEHILDFGPWKWNTLNMGYMDKRPSRMQRSSQGQGMPRSRGPRLWLLSGAPACRPNACNTCRRYLERPFRNRCELSYFNLLVIDASTSDKETWTWDLDPRKWRSC